MIKQLYKTIEAWLDYNPPNALSAKGWRLFNKEFKEKAPIRYWIRNIFRYNVAYPFSRKYTEFYEFISCRLFNRYHIVNTGLKPGYVDLDRKILNVNFNMLKDFVECELAWSRHGYNPENPWYKKIRIVRMIKRSSFRDPKLGIEYLDWASKLDDPNLPPYQQCVHQAESARETRELYDWWVNKRPARKSIDIPKYNDQGLDMFDCIDEDFDKNAEDFKKFQDAMAARSTQGADWYMEDTEMLVRLMKVRQNLWT